MWGTAITPGQLPEQITSNSRMAMPALPHCSGTSCGPCSAGLRTQTSASQKVPGASDSWDSTRIYDKRNNRPVAMQSVLLELARCHLRRSLIFIHKTQTHRKQQCSCCTSSFQQSQTKRAGLFILISICPSAGGSQSMNPDINLQLGHLPNHGLKRCFLYL